MSEQLYEHSKFRIFPQLKNISAKLSANREFRIVHKFIKCNFYERQKTQKIIYLRKWQCEGCDCEVKGQGMWWKHPHDILFFLCILRLIRRLFARMSWCFIPLPNSFVHRHNLCAAVKNLFTQENLTAYFIVTETPEKTTSQLLDVAFVKTFQPKLAVRRNV